MLIYKDIARCLFSYDTLLLDYFYYRYFDKDVDKQKFTNVWDMYQFQSKFNSLKHYMIFRDKIQFRKHFDKFFSYPYLEIQNKRDFNSLIEWIKANKMSKVVAKEPLGAVGKGVEVFKITEYNGQLKFDDENAEIVIERMFNKGFKLYEGFIEQHKEMAALSPTSVNTIRVVTFLNDDNELEIWGTLLRMGYDKAVDNFDAGGLGAKIDVKTGEVLTPGFVKDPFNQIKYDVHPITKEKILGKRIPFWDEIIEMVKEIAYIIPEVRTVGWDFAITESGPTLIEGNDNWDKTFFQLGTGIPLNNRIKQLIKS